MSLSASSQPTYLAIHHESKTLIQESLERPELDMNMNAVSCREQGSASGMHVSTELLQEILRLPVVRPKIRVGSSNPMRHSRLLPRTPKKQTIQDHQKSLQPEMSSWQRSRRSLLWEQIQPAVDRLRENPISELPAGGESGESCSGSTGSGGARISEPGEVRTPPVRAPAAADTLDRSFEVRRTNSNSSSPPPGDQLEGNVFQTPPSEKRPQ